jgi:hypothetical protein
MSSAGRRTEKAPRDDTNGVALSEYVYEDAELSDFQTISRAVNYELNELHTQIEKQQGTVEKLSVAVLLNSSLNNEDYSESIVRLVSNAIGVDESSVTVESLPFMENQNETELSEVFDEQATVMDSLKKKELTQTLIIAGTPSCSSWSCWDSCGPSSEAGTPITSPSRPRAKRSTSGWTRTSTPSPKGFRISL